MNITATHTTTDNNWQNGTTTVWFDIEVEDSFYNGQYGVVMDMTSETLVDSDGEPVRSTNSLVYGQILEYLKDYAKLYV